MNSNYQNRENGAKRQTTEGGPSPLLKGGAAAAQIERAQRASISCARKRAYFIFYFLYESIIKGSPRRGEPSIFYIARQVSFGNPKTLVFFNSKDFYTNRARAHNTRVHYNARTARNKIWNLKLKTVN